MLITNKYSLEYSRISWHMIALRTLIVLQFLENIVQYLWIVLHTCFDESFGHCLRNFTTANETDFMHFERRFK